MKFVGVCFSALLVHSLALNGEQMLNGGNEHHHHHHHHRLAKGIATKDTAVKEGDIVAKMKALETHLAEKQKTRALATETGHLLVNGPLPVDFAEQFSQAVAQATGADAGSIKVTKSHKSKESPVVSVDFIAQQKVVAEVEDQAADAESNLAMGNLHAFLVAKSDETAEPEKSSKKSKAAAIQGKGIDIDTAMPYGDLEAFGREDTAQELTESSVTESNTMVDQLERAEVAEEKRSVFRALTRLRGAAITSFDGVARSQTGNIDEYNKINKWRQTHPVHHLANEEADVSKWAFPNNAD